MFFSRTHGSCQRAWRAPCQAYLCFIVILLLAFLPSRGTAEVSVAPRLVELTYKDNSKTLQVINTGSETRTYRMSLLNYQMDENGRIKLAVSETGQDRFADKLIRYSPRQITLEPGEVQTVRVLYRRSSKMEVGEYRSHLLFQSVPTPRPAPVEEEEQSKLGIKIEAIFGISIPIIIYHGDLSATAEITHLELTETEAGEPALSLHIERAGNRSLRGNLTATVNGKEVARLNNLAVYLSVPYRRVVLPLALDDSLKGQKLIIEYHKNKKDGGALITSSEKIIQ